MTNTVGRLSVDSAVVDGRRFDRSSRSSTSVYRLQTRRTTMAAMDIKHHLVTNRTGWRKYFYLALPHVCLIIVSISYIVAGAAIFMKLEEPQAKKLQSQKVAQISSDRANLMSRLWQLARDRRPIEEGRQEFQKFVQSLYAVHKTSKWRIRDLEMYSLNGDSSEVDMVDEWNFSAALIFVLTTLTTIGYGNVVPITREGRLFCIFYCCVGIPLILVTMADLAKFMSSGLLFIYVRYLKLKEKVKDRMTTKPAAGKSRKSTRGSFGDFKETENLLFTSFDRVSFVELHATVILFILFGYICLGSEAFCRIELWQYVESLYFTFVSILTIGFGDMLPWNQQYHWFVVLYVCLGVTIATMCIDTVGSRYVQKIHQLGKQVKSTNYIDLIHRMQKNRERRERYRALRRAAKVAMAIQFVSDNPEVEEEEVNEGIVTAPFDFRLVDVWPYAVKLSWNYEGKLPKDAYFVLRFHKICHDVLENVYTMVTRAPEFEITGLDSCTIYAVKLSATDGKIETESSSLIVLTEPETCPQEISVTQVDSSTAIIKWNPPFKMKKFVKGYTIYYTNEPTLSYEEWDKLYVPADQLTATICNLDGVENYFFCMSSVYSKTHSPISKLIHTISFTSRVCTVEEMSRMREGSPSFANLSILTEIAEHTA